MTRICVLDYGMGNLRSVEKALERVGAQVAISSSPVGDDGFDGLVLPGVGAFPKAMQRITELGLDRTVRDWADARRPLLGICLGMQLLFEGSSEHGGAEGLGLMAGRVMPLDAPGLKVPHIGWEPVRWSRQGVLTAGLPGEAPFYFVHSLAPRPDDPADIVGTATWGSPFACVVERGSIGGVQFHPEKSGAAGLRLLENFARACAAVPA